MGRIQGFLAVSRHSIGAGEISTVSTRHDVLITLWVEKGSVDLIEDVNQPERIEARLQSRCSVPLRPGEVHLRNAGKSPALVFVAMAQAADPLLSRHRIKKNMPNAAPPDGDGAAAPPDEIAAHPGIDHYYASCTCGQFFVSGLAWEDALRLKKEHRKLGCGGELEGPTRCA